MPPEPGFATIDDLAARIPDGCLLAVPKDESGVSMAATRALIRRGAKELRLLCVPTSGLQADMLIGAGCVTDIECGAVTLDEYGMAPRFRQAVESATLRIVDSTCPAIYAALQAAEKGSPFAAMRGIIGSDILRHRNDWQVIENPFADGDDPVLLVPALKPDVALFHARLADRQGNVWVGNKRELVIMAHAARSVLVTAEKIVDEDLVSDERYAAGTIATLYVDAVAPAENGAWPLGLAGRYPPDADELTAYARLATTPEGFADYLSRYLQAGDAHD